MPAGRPATPSAIRKLTGTHLERISKREAVFHRVDGVTVPKRVQADPYAMTKWEEIVPDLVANGLLTRSNQGLCAQICLAHAQVERALDDIEDRGRNLEEPIVNKKGDVVGTRFKPNPSIAQLAQFMALTCRLMIEFGITPASATKVAASPEAAQEAESFDEFTAGSDERGDEKSGAEVN